MGEEFYGGICSTANWCNTSLLNDHSMNWTESFSQAAEMYNLSETDYGDETNEVHNGLLPILFEPVHSLNNYTMNDSFKPCTEVTNEPNFLSINTMKRSREVKCDETECNETKKARISLLSHLPTFKVRKEKLGDRVTALQQLVSPFGKTDTASVLQEAVDHIKFLHSQIGALSKAFFRNSHDMVQESMEISRDAGIKKEPRSDGLCLVPVSLTFVLAREEPAMDIWAAAFCGSHYI